MSDAEKGRYVVVNHQNQPVELYLPSGLIVLPPRGQAELAEADLAAPQLRVLCASRVVTTREAAPAEPQPGAEYEATGGDVTEPGPDEGH